MSRVSVNSFDPVCNYFHLLAMSSAELLQLTFSLQGAEGFSFLAMPTKYWSAGNAGDLMVIDEKAEE